VADVKLTKNELRNQQMHLAQLEKYLPTLQLKKAMLQAEVNEVRQEIHRLEKELEAKRQQVDLFSTLLTTRTTIDPLQAVQVKTVRKHYENIAGVEVPYFEGVDFEDFTYSLFETAPWVDAAIVELRNLANLREHTQVAIENIRIIKVFLGDQQLAAVSRAKVAKTKIEANKEARSATRQQEKESS
jgi:V/A-type H+-transporting ATPase subunit D